LFDEKKMDEQIAAKPVIMTNEGKRNMRGSCIN